MIQPCLAPLPLPLLIESSPLTETSGFLNHGSECQIDDDLTHVWYHLASIEVDKKTVVPQMYLRVNETKSPGIWVTLVHRRRPR